MKRLTFATFAVLLATLTAIAAPDNPKPQAPPMPAIRAMAPVSHLAQEEPINFGASLLYDPLYIWEPGEKGPQLRPCLAADWPEYSEDGLTCTIRLRPGAKLHYNGGSRRPRRVIEIVASDIVFTLKYGAKLRNHNGYSILEGVIDGLDAIPAGRKATDWGALDEEFEVAGLNVVDNNTLERFHSSCSGYPQWRK